MNPQRNAGGSEAPDAPDVFLPPDVPNPPRTPVRKEPWVIPPAGATLIAPALLLPGLIRVTN